MNIQKKPVLVTGGTGLVGSHLIYALVSQGEKVRAIYRKTSNRNILKKVIGYYTTDPEKLYGAVEWIECDIRDYDRLAVVIKEVKVVYHCAAVVSFETGVKDYIIKNNVQGTANVVRACIENNIEKLCYVSSIGALGSPGTDFIVNETNNWNEAVYHSVYSISKHLSEEEVWKGINKGLCAVIVNPSVILGPGDWSRGSSLFFSVVDRGMLFFTEGITGYVDVNDVVKAMITLTKSPISGERFIVNSENLTFRQLFTIIARNLHVKEPFFNVPKFFYPLILPFVNITGLFTGKTRRLTKDSLRAAWAKTCFDNSKIIAATGISFTPIEKSVKAIADIYLSEKRKK